MLIHSARHITYLGRHLKINSPSEFSSDSTILVLTKSIDIPFNIKEKTRITSEEIESKFNFFINNELYFMTFVPEIYFPFQENLTLLVQADPDYFSEDYFEKVQAFISKSHPAKTIISGNYSEKWFSAFKSRKNIAVRNEISQPGIF